MAATRVIGRFALGLVGPLLALGLALVAPALSSADHKPVQVRFQVHETSTPPFSNSGLYSLLTSSCPGSGKGKSYPYGGVVSPMPLPQPSGTYNGDALFGDQVVGLFPLGIERRGAQNDNHFILNGVNTRASFTISFSAEGVSVCGPKAKLTPVQTIVQVNPGQTQTTVSSCPPGTTLLGGNFARTFFTPQGGDFATQSRGDIANNSWVVSATGFGSFGGPVTDTAFCAKFKRPNVQVLELPGSVQINPHSVGMVSTPACPARYQWVWGGFDESPRGSVLFAGGYLSDSGWYAGYALNRTNSPATFDYYSYCAPKSAFKVKPQKP